MSTDNSGVRTHASKAAAVGAVLTLTIGLSVGFAGTASAVAHGPQDPAPHGQVGICHRVGGAEVYIAPNAQGVVHGHDGHEADTPGLCVETDLDTTGPLETPDETLETPDETLETPDETLETPDQTLETPDETLETPDQTLETPAETSGPDDIDGSDETDEGAPGEGEVIGDAVELELPAPQADDSPPAAEPAVGAQPGGDRTDPGPEQLVAPLVTDPAPQLDAPLVTDPAPQLDAPEVLGVERERPTRPRPVNDVAATTERVLGVSSGRALRPAVVVLPQTGATPGVTALGLTGAALVLAGGIIVSRRRGIRAGL